MKMMCIGIGGYELLVSELCFCKCYMRMLKALVKLVDMFLP